VKPFDVPMMLFVFLGFVAVIPGWVYFTMSHPHVSDLQLEARFLVQLALPASLLLFLAGWLE
jgi:Sec-independent protein secretion pathway component TatC